MVFSLLRKLCPCFSSLFFSFRVLEERDPGSVEKIATGIAALRAKFDNFWEDVTVSDTVMCCHQLPEIRLRAACRCTDEMASLQTAQQRLDAATRAWEDAQQAWEEIMHRLAPEALRRMTLEQAAAAEEEEKEEEKKRKWPSFEEVQEEIEILHSERRGSEEDSWDWRDEGLGKLFEKNSPAPRSGSDAPPRPPP